MDIYKQQADLLAYWMAKGKTFRQAVQLVARGRKPRRAKGSKS